MVYDTFDEKRHASSRSNNEVPLPSRKERLRCLRRMAMIAVACLVFLSTFQSLSMIPVFTKYIPTEDQVQPFQEKGTGSVFSWQNVSRSVILHEMLLTHSRLFLLRS